MTEQSRVLLTGATGCVGHHLYPELIASGFDVRCASRDPDRARRDFPGRRFVSYQALDPTSTATALEGCDLAFFLVHGLGQSNDYEDFEWRAAATFIEAARRAGVRRVVYLGGMRPRGTPSKHLRSRLRTGSVLRSLDVSTVELQAGVVVGEGSESWRIIRDLVARLPLMVLPEWMESRHEPLWIGDAVAALVAAATDPISGSRAFALPGGTRLSAREIIETTARLHGRAPWVLEAPLITPEIAGRWVSWITRADPDVAVELVKGLTSDVVAERRDSYWARMDGFEPVGFESAARRALARQEAPPMATRILERMTDVLTPRAH